MKKIEEPKYTREVEFRLTRGEGNNSWMSWIKEDRGWVPLRIAPTTYESAQAAVYDSMTDWAFPRNGWKR